MCQRLCPDTCVRSSVRGSGRVALFDVATRRHVKNMLDSLLAAVVRVNAAESSRAHGVSARTVYRHQARVRRDGQCQARSRRPHHIAGQTPPELEALICKLREQLVPDNGADYIRDAL